MGISTLGDWVQEVKLLGGARSAVEDALLGRTEVLSSKEANRLFSNTFFRRHGQGWSVDKGASILRVM